MTSSFCVDAAVVDKVKPKYAIARVDSGYLKVVATDHGAEVLTMFICVLSW